MESANGLSDLRNVSYFGKYPPLHPFVFPLSSVSNSDSSSIESRGDLTYGEAANGHHRCSSENSLLYEQPSWFEDLLKDPETPFRGLHRRSASDSFAYLEQAAETITSTEEPNYGLPVNYRDAGSTLDYKAASMVDKNNQESEEMLSSFGVELTRDEHSAQNHESSAYKDSATQAKPAGSKECKRKQHNAHRSRVRKLHYIAHLEKTVEMLKVEGSGFSSELEFLEQQNMILTMENKALRQRLESVSQEQLIKQWEQGMLEREIARLQSLYHLQQQQQVHLQMQHQHKQQQQKQRRNKSRDLDHQAKNKDSSPSRGSINSCAQA